MPVTLTLRNVPDDLYERLKRSAETRGRSLSNEALACLESALRRDEELSLERLTRTRASRSALPKKAFSTRDIDAFKRRGRP